MNNAMLLKHAQKVNKPIVVYKEAHILQTGIPAFLRYVYRHPSKKVKGKGWVRTSVVINLLGLGSFETLNTIYTPKNPLDFDRTRHDEQLSA